MTNLGGNRPDASWSPRICHLTSVHPWDDVRVFRKECSTLAEAGYDTHLVATGPRAGFERGVRIHAAPRLSGRVRRTLATPRQVYRLARTIDAALYHFHDPDLLPVGLWLARRGKRVIYDAHEDVAQSLRARTYLPGWISGPGSSAIGAFERAVSRRMTAVVAATPTIAERLRKNNPRTVAINNYPILEEWPEVDGIAWNSRRQSVVYVGALCRERGVTEMAQAMAVVSARRRVTLELAGEFSPSDERRHVADQPGWGHAREHGVLSRECVVDLMRGVRAGLVVLHPEPRFLASQPIKLYEYMAAGIPVIASDFPLWRDLIAGAGCGLLVDPMNPKAIAGAIDYVFSHPDEAAAMGQRGRRAITERYNWATEGATLLDLYADILSLDR
jgi:glycosyltransferase involved in cell wall biosynthesis